MGGFKRLAALPRTRGSALAHGCGREGSGALPLPRAAAVSTRLKVPSCRGRCCRSRRETRRTHAWLGVGSGLGLE